MRSHATAAPEHGSSCSIRRGLRSGTLPPRRVLELGAILVAGALFAATAYLALSGARTLWVPLGFLLLGLIAADAISGTVHWLADTYGTPGMPVFGAFVRTFREHHADAKAITRHDWIETNGDVCLFSAPVHAVALFWADDPWILSWMTGLFAGSYSNSQIHKWSHMDHAPRLVRWLQRFRLVLSSSHHQVHHRGPHLTHYCITTGWTNGVLDHLRVFRILERALRVLGIPPNARSSVPDPVPVVPLFEGRPD
ncbi:MAG TPA: fatty acid desaturase CarF family protein [Polyangiaceae bacterium]|nr:fatty acid desaturase CarF family protein [Polyangiaceae bacterium]